MTQQTSSPPSTAGRQRHLWDYWRAIWEGRWILMACLVITLAVAVAGTHYMSPRYRADTTIEINFSRGAVLGAAAERWSRLGFFEQERAFQTEFYKMKTRELLSRAITENDLFDRIDGLSSADDPLKILRRQISISNIPNTNLARMSVVWFDAQDAADIANAVAATYVAWDLEERIRLSTERARSLEAGARKTSGSRVSEMQWQLAVLDDDPRIETVMTLPRFDDNASLGTLRDEVSKLERELDSLLQVHGSRSPTVQAKRSDLGRARSQVKKEVKAVRDQLEADLRAMGAEPLSGDQAREAVDRGRREADDTIVNQLYERLNEQQMLATLAEPKAKVIDPALPPDAPFAPNLFLNLALAAVVGIGFGSGLVFFRERFDVAVKTIDDVEQDLGLNLLAVVPHVKKEMTPVSREAFHTLRTGLLFGSRARRHRILLVTSSGPQEGKSWVTANLARSLAGSGERVAVIDCDLRRPSAHRQLGVSADHGLTNYLADSTMTDWRSLLKPAAENVWLLPSGPVPPNPLDLLGQQRFAELLESAKESHDWVLVDSPPLSSVSDGVVLASLAEMVLVVIRHDATDKDVVQRALGRLSGVGATVVGAVVNDVDMRKSYNRDYYYGRFYYGHYYGTPEADAGGRKRSAKAG